MQHHTNLLQALFAAVCLVAMGLLAPLPAMAGESGEPDDAEGRARLLDDPATGSASCGNQDDPDEPFEATYEFKLSSRGTGTLAIPAGSYVHVELSGGAMRINDHRDWGLDAGVRVDLTPPESTLRPFVRLATGVYRGGASTRSYPRAIDGWFVRVTTGLQVRLHRHFGVELEGGLRHEIGVAATPVNKVTSIYYAFGLVAYL